MIRRFWYLTLLLLVLVTTTTTTYQRVQGEDDGWQSINDGITFQEFVLADPNHVFVARMDRSNQNVTLESAIANGKLGGGRETVSKMAARYDEAINNWDGSWGTRNQVVVAINGSYFNPATGWPENGVVQSGWFAKHYADLEGWSGFAWSLDRNATIGECVAQPPDKQFVTFENGETLRIDGLNVPRGANQMILYTPQFDATTRSSPGGVEVVVEMSRPTLILPAPKPNVAGFVREIRDGQSPAIIPFDGIVLSASGSARETLLRDAWVGEEIRINQEITSYADDCETRNPDIRWEKTYAAIGGAFNFLRAGEIRHMNDGGAVHPRTAIAYNQDYIFFIVVDGRAPGYSVGMSLDQLAKFSRDTLGATDGIAQDGGGSSTMVINGVVVNRPSDVCPLLKNKVFLPLIGQSAAPGQAAAVNDLPPLTPQPPSGTICERPVANGMLMVEVEPKVVSTSFLPDDPFIISIPANIRTGPGTNYPVLGVAQPGERGYVVNHYNNLDGVLAKGAYWWQVKVGGLVGWVSEAALAHNYHIPSRWASNN